MGLQKITRVKEKKSHKNECAGVTLTELIIVMGVFGIILSAIWWAASNAREAQEENSGYTELQTVAQNIIGVLGGRKFSTTYDYPNNGYTSVAIAAQTLPSTFVDPASDNAKANNPWIADGFSIYIPSTTLNPNYLGAPVYETSGKIFRLSFSNVPTKGCIALLLKMTTCQAGQSGCPVAVYTDFAASTTACSPNQTNCPPGVAAPAWPAPQIPPINIGWQSMGLSAASAMCAANPAGGGSVDFDYSL